MVPRTAAMVGHVANANREEQASGREEKAVGAVEKTTTHSNHPTSKHLPFPPFFFPDNVEDRYLAATAMMHVIQPIINEWPIKPPFDNRQVLLATPQAS